MTPKKAKKLTRDEYADKWRRDYDKLACSDQREIYDKCRVDAYIFPEKEPPKEWFAEIISYNLELPFKFFDYVCSKRKTVRVIEFGGAVGQLANAVMDKHGGQIEAWRNYEIQSYAITKNLCKHPQYEPVVSDKFFWELDDVGEDWDVFVSAHSIEHVRGSQARRIFEKIKMVDFMYLESPICDDSTGLSNKDNVNRFFSECSALHILELGWKQLLEMLPDFRVIEDLSIPYILGTREQGDCNIKTIYHKGGGFHVSLMNGFVIRIYGRGTIRFDTPENGAGVRCIERKQEGYIEPTDSEEMILKSACN